jgi:hypothetical protein
MLFDSKLDERGQCCLALDSNRIPHISYREERDGSGPVSNVKYAAATEPEEEPTDTSLQQPFPALPLLIGSAIVVVGVVGTVIYFWKKKT